VIAFSWQRLVGKARFFGRPRWDLEYPEAGSCFLRPTFIALVCANC
jgi:hypothetical protein